MIFDLPVSAMLKGLELNGRSFFLLRGCTDHSAIFFAYRQASPHYRPPTDQARSSILQELPQLLDMVKRKAEKQQSAGTEYVY